MSIFYHTATVKRVTGTLSNGSETLAESTPYTSLACLAEAHPAWRQSTVFGQFVGRQYIFSWGSETLFEDDIITLSHLPGRTFRLQLTADDTGRPAGMTSIPSYQTGILIEGVVARTA